MNTRIRIGYAFIGLVLFLMFGTLFLSLPDAAGYSDPIKLRATPTTTDWATFWKDKSLSFSWEAYFEWTEEGAEHPHTMLFKGTAYRCAKDENWYVDPIELRAWFSFRDSNGTAIFLRETNRKDQWPIPFESDITPVPTNDNVTPVMTPAPFAEENTPAASSAVSIEAAATEEVFALVPLVSPIKTYSMSVTVGGSALPPLPEDGDAIKCTGACTYEHEFLMTFEVNYETNKVTIQKVEFSSEDILAKVECNLASGVANRYCHSVAPTMAIEYILKGEITGFNSVSSSLPIVADLVPLNDSRCVSIE